MSKWIPPILSIGLIITQGRLEKARANCLDVDFEADSVAAILVAAAAPAAANAAWTSMQKSPIPRSE
ncbi:hypothetical protein JOC55_000153 [Paenibacillus sacheonensis]|nr:hypothetical protein [Paenibacillus sacheonensis]